MNESVAPDGDPLVERSLELMEGLLAEYHPRDFGVRFWDGTELPAEQPPQFTLRLERPTALRRIAGTDSDLGAGEAFVFGDFDVEGDLESIFPVVERVADRHWALAERLRLLVKGAWLPAPRDEGTRSRLGASIHGRRHSKGRDRQAISYHYDVSNRFYSLWLDRNMIYSCGYFRKADDDLDAAQVAKMDLICRKLRLAPGERVLDIGCGWGGLVMHAASEYGAEAVGITLSERQADLARERIAAAGLSGRCRVELVDYRDAPALGAFDKVASVGMFEHVGEAMLAEYFRAAHDVLRPGGLFLNHGIAQALERRVRRRDPSFRDVYVFPDGELVTISEALAAAEDVGLEVRDVESLREHYATTLRHWVRRLEAAREEAVAEVGEETYRVWRLFMSASAHAFARGRLGVYQSLLAKPGAGGACELPPTREDLYRDRDRRPQSG